MKTKTRPELPSKLFLFLTLLAIVLFCARPAAAENFYSWPPNPSLPGGQGKVFFDWTPLANDTYSADALLDLRYLNEQVAGQDGWIQQVGDKFFLPSGKQIRFWSVNCDGNADFAVLQDVGRFLAKKGINMVRCHGPKKSLVDNASDDVNAVDPNVVDQVHRLVTAMKQSGIYTYVSNELFIIEFHVKAAWGIPGYTQDWLDAHPTQDVPYGLFFLDDKLRAAYKNWITVLMTSANPYEDSQTPLCQERAVGMVEILNEENLFFNTFDPANWPPEQQVSLFERFYNWVTAKYNTTAQDILTNIWKAPALPTDNVAAGQLAIVNATTMGFEKSGRLALRVADQLEFLSEIQRGFYEDIVAYHRSMGYQGMISASNWRTSNDKKLLDMEFYTYTPGNVIDLHNYFSPAVEQTVLSYAVSAGDKYVSFAAVVNPRRSPLCVKQVEGHPFSVSESTWVNYNPAAAEGPLSVAAYLSLGDVDHWTWFALGPIKWSSSMAKWPVGDPVLLGQFPAAALLYRRGDVAEAPTVIREGRTPNSFYQKETALIFPAVGFDPTRDDPSQYNGNPQSSLGALDPLAMLVGKVELAFDTDKDFVNPEIFGHINGPDGVATAITGQVSMDQTSGLVTVNSPRCQGAAGFLKDAGDLALDDVVIKFHNNFGAVTVISLDDLPLAQSSKILVQAATYDQPTGFDASYIKMTWNNNDYAGYQINSTGGMPWQVERIDAQIVFPALGSRITAVKALDPDGYFKSAILGAMTGAGYEITLPEDSLYTVVELSPPANLTPVILSRAFPNGKVGAAYDHALQAASGDGALTWDLVETGTLPSGLAFDSTGHLAGTPGQGGLYHVSVKVTDADGNSDTQVLPLAILPLPAGLWGDLMTYQAKKVGFGWIYDGYYPYIWIYSTNAFAWVWPDSTLASTLMWVYQDGGYWTWVGDQTGGWHYNFDGPNPGWNYWP